MASDQSENIVFERLFHANSRDLGSPKTVEMPIGAPESFAAPNAAGDMRTVSGLAEIRTIAEMAGRRVVALKQ